MQIDNSRAAKTVMGGGAGAGASIQTGKAVRTHYKMEAFTPLTLEECVHQLNSTGVATDVATLNALIHDEALSVGRRNGICVVPTGEIVRYCHERGSNVAALNFYNHLKWVEEFDNLVVNEGLDDSLDKHFKGSIYTAAWYVGLTDGTPTPAAGDTIASHAGGAEVTAYDELVRQTLTLGAVSGQSVDNSASKATFTIDTNNTVIGGAFVITDDTKGGAVLGTLYGVGAFTAADKTLDDDDTIAVTVTLTAAAS